MDENKISIAAIASGSNGNCYYVGTNEGSLLVDIGITYKQLMHRSKELGIDLKTIRGILISHEHSDHVRGITRTAKALNVPVYVTRKTLNEGKLIIDKKHIEFFEPNQKFSIGSIIIDPFSKNHDASEPCSFVITKENKNIAILTDIGHPCKNVIERIKDADIAFLETNYDETMLQNGKYPYHLKKRVAGKKGHLSNYEAALLILEHATPRLKTILLSHLSENNNTPELAYNTVTQIIKERKDLTIETIVTSREAPSQIIHLEPFRQ
ncbi:MAG: MBL fold metallo-hydrolase [Candidatus Woesearchaeota archaeon]